MLDPLMTDDPMPDPRHRTSRRGVLAGLGIGALGLGALATQGPRILRDRGIINTPDDQNHASCADPESLTSHNHIGGARLVYEISGKQSAMQFEPGFHAQLVRWLADWNATSRYRGVREIWSYGAYVPKDGCHSWHAAGRGFDISRLRAGSTLLVSAREDLWHEAPPQRRAVLRRRYWTLGASLNLHFAYVLSHHFDLLHRNHFHVDNSVSGQGMSRFNPDSRVQNQSVQAICASIWGRPGEVTGQWSDARRQVAPVLDDLGLHDLTRQPTWQAFLRASVRRG